MASPTLRWLSLVGIIWLQSFDSTNTNFPAYSSQLKQQLSLSQLQLNNLAFASDSGKLFGCLCGVVALYFPLWLVLLIGSALGSIGYGLQYVFLACQVSPLSYWFIFFLNVLAGNSICWINTVCYIVAVQNFSSQLHATIGLATSYSGLSAMIYTSLVDDAFPARLKLKRAQSYLILNSTLPILVSLITSPLFSSIHRRHEESGESVPGLPLISIITIATGLYATASSIFKIRPNLNVVVIGLCLVFPLVVPLCECLRGMILRSRRVEDRARLVDAEGGSKPRGAFVMEEVGVKVMVKRLNFWLYFSVYFLGATLGLVFMNNLGQISESRGSSRRTSSLVSLSSAFSFFGRLLPCLLYYICSRVGRFVPGPAIMVVMMVPFSGGFFLLLNGSELALTLSTATIGLCTGALTSLSVSVTKELFGTTNFGVNHNIVVANIPIGSFVFGNAAALLYRSVAVGGQTCFGLDCYKWTFVLWGCLCSFGTTLALLLHFRTRHFYLATS